jgi:ABC-type multidrug transport system fused ATPase/permease subunit
MLLILVLRSFSKQSSVSVDDYDQEFHDEAFDNNWKKMQFLHKPFFLKILKFNAPEWPWILLGTISSGLIGVTQPLFAFFLSLIYGLFADPNLEKQKRLTSIYAISIFLVGFSRGILQFLSSLGFAKSGEALTMRMRKLSLNALLRQEIGYFDEEANSVGSLITRLSSDASALKV